MANDNEFDRLFEGDEFSLESILSEFKSDAYVKGEKKTPPDKLEQQFNQILEETGRKPAPQPTKVADSTMVFAPVQEKPAPAPQPAPTPTPKPQPAPQPQVLYADESDEDSGKYFESKEFQEQVARQLETQDDWSQEDMKLPFDSQPPLPIQEEEEEDERPGLFSRLFHRAETPEEEMPEPIAPDAGEEEPEEDFSQAEELNRFNAPLAMTRLRALWVAILTLGMLVLTHLFTGGYTLPFGLDSSTSNTVATLLVAQLLTMLLGLDVLLSGLSCLVRGKPGNDTLVLFSCLCTFADGFWMLYTKSFAHGLPFAVVSSASLFFALRGRVNYGKAMTETLRMLGTAGRSYGVVMETFFQDNEKRTVLKKAENHTAGFFKRLYSQDGGEIAYGFAVPFLILATLVFAVLSSLGQGRGGDFPHALALMAAVTAAFPVASLFALPMRYAATGLKNTGVALAGWLGACELYEADGCLVTDRDVFPAGSVSLSGVKFFEGYNNRESLQLASSLLVAANCGISSIFTELLRTQNLKPRPVTDFMPQPSGGFSGLVDGHLIQAGSVAFMQLLPDIQVPEAARAMNAVYAAIDGHLAVVYSVNYVPVDAVRSALNALLNTRTGIFMALRDFNLTANTLRQKYRLSMDGVETLPLNLRFALTEGEPKETTPVSAVLLREGLQPLARAITKGRLVKVVTELNTLISLGGTVIGLLLMFFLASSGSFASASPENTFLFMSAIGICVFLLSQLVRRS